MDKKELLEQLLKNAKQSKKRASPSVPKRFLFHERFTPRRGGIQTGSPRGELEEATRRHPEQPQSHSGQEGGDTGSEDGDEEGAAKQGGDPDE